LADEMMTIGEAVRRLQAAGVRMYVSPAGPGISAKVGVTPENAAFAVADPVAFVAQGVGLTVEDYETYEREWDGGMQCMASTTSGARCRNRSDARGSTAADRWRRDEQRCSRHMGHPEHPGIRAGEPPEWSATRG
jgi:hypothetical protein